MLSIPETSIDYWRSRLADHDFAVEESEVFGEKRLAFSHPCGIEYALVGVASDERPAHSSGPVPQEFGIHGTHGITI